MFTPQELLEELKDKDFVLPQLKKLLQLKRKTFRMSPLTVYYYRIPKKQMQQYLTRAHLIHSLFQIKKPLTFIIVPADVPRHFPHPTEAVTEKHINGGYTYLNKDTIFIYRYEDFPKVMLHEVLHHSALNTSSPYNEAIIEFWALLLHLLFVATNNYDKLLQEELTWNLSLCKKLQAHPADTSHAYSYIFIKTLLLFFKKDFLHTPQKEQTSFIEKHKQHPLFLQAIQDAPIPSNNSMRMVLHGNA